VPTAVQAVINGMLFYTDDIKHPAFDPVNTIIHYDQAHIRFFLQEWIEYCLAATAAGIPGRASDHGLA
jgi:hypothetical protein